MARKTTTSLARRFRPRPPAANRDTNVARLARRILRGVGWSLLGLVLSIALLRFVPPPTTSFMLIRHVERIFEAPPGPDLRYEWTPMEKISRHMALAAVAAEDQNFPRHFGFDIGAIERALEHNSKRRTVRGASTISQQVAKNLFLWSGRSYVRKGLEAGLTILIESMWSKKRILEVYLNIAEFGNGTYGVGAAARRFFGTTPDKLTRHEAAVLASVLPSPRRLLAQRPSPYLLQRANRIQAQMRQLGTDYLHDL